MVPSGSSSSKQIYYPGVILNQIANRQLKIIIRSVYVTSQKMFKPVDGRSELMTLCIEKKNELISDKLINE